MLVRRERPSDHAGVEALHRAAFGPPDRAGGVAEARLVDLLRADVAFLPHLSLVAVEGAAITGHVIATRGRLEPLGTPVLGLGPVGVHPRQQGRGTGTVLVHALLAVAEAAGERLVGLLGDPRYYRRFGFVPAAELGVLAPEPRWGQHFQARWLAEPGTGGTFRYAAPFDRL